MNEQPYTFAFADSVNLTAIPKSITHVAGYADGRYKSTAAQLEVRQAHILLSVTGDPAAARDARAQDIERYDATIAEFPGFASERLAHGHRDALAYCSLSRVAALNEYMRDHAVPWWLWVAWWWRQSRPPTRREVVQALRVRYGVQIPTWRIQGCQWRRGLHYDQSVWYGPDDFTRPHKHAA